MDSSQHGAMVKNEEDIQMNNFIYGTPKTELRMQSYDMMNKCINYMSFRDLVKYRVKQSGREIAKRRTSDG